MKMPVFKIQGKLLGSVLAIVVFLLVHTASTCIGKEPGFLAGCLVAGIVGATISRLRRSNAGAIDLFMAHAVATVSTGFLIGAMGSAIAAAITFFLLDRWTEVEKRQPTMR